MAIGNSVGDEIREERRKAMGRMTPKEKFSYFWDYYKFHALAAVAITATAISLIYHYVNYKDYGFYAALINAVVTDLDQDSAATWAEEFQEYAAIDPEEYEVYIDTSISMSPTDYSQATVANQQKMMAMLQTGSVSVMIAETETFENYAQQELFYNIEELLSPEELEKYRPYLYYTDAGTFPDDDYEPTAEIRDLSVLTIDHRDPSTMENPIAVGIIVTQDNLIEDAHYYSHLENGDYNYQGYPSEAVLGVPVTNKQPELVVRFLEYLKLGE